MPFHLFEFLRSVLVTLISCSCYFILVDWQYPKKLVFSVCGACFLGLCAVDFTIRLFVPMEGMTQLLFFILIIAVMVCFSFWVSLYRDTRTFFAAASALLMSVVSGGMGGFMDIQKHNDILHIVGLLIIVPVTWAYLWQLRRPIHEMMAALPEGWGWLSLIPLSFHLLFILLVYIPTSLRDRPANLLPTLVLIVMTVLVYSSFSAVFRKIQTRHELEQENILMSLQLSSMGKRIEDAAQAEESTKKLHHDLRHYSRIISTCIRNGDTDEALSILAKVDEESGKTLSGKIAPIYCSSPAVNAVLSYCCARAEECGVSITAGLDLPPRLSEDTAELSVVLANALENAIHACEAMPLGMERTIVLTGKAVHSQYLITLTNTYFGKIRFDSDTGIPLSGKANHGVGARSILAYAKQTGAQLHFSAENGVFRMDLLIDLPS